MRKLYSEYHAKFGTTLEEIGFPAGSDIYVSIPGVYYSKVYREVSFDKAKFPFTMSDYESFYDAKIAFVTTPILNYVWGRDKYDNIYYHTLIYNYLKSKGYYIYTKCFRPYNTDSIFVNKLYKYLEGNLLTVVPAFTDVIVQNYNPLGFVKISFKESDEKIIEELKYIL